MNHQDFEELSAQEGLADAINLPDEQRQIFTLIIRQKKVTLEEVIVHTNLAKEIVQKHLETLIFQGIIQESNENSDVVYYQPHLISKKKSRLNKNIWNKL
ncbi:ArsR family transcriptional regulator [Dendronalium sp. ChiSLP03b]|uniref:ArsR family transcriptional regulator n=1 Tax=Dendronalium sp. ChiSLP03b TaxID=3075381 RepID=UPI002AD518C5|nr:ArsR family transcriptional regulator [Dendronalium sp. ChiSLP03b]MDZ8206139.1 ArsR family transcriptional regulator [Dendronalium sp. ChiSLP03b]